NWHQGQRIVLASTDLESAQQVLPSPTLPNEPANQPQTEVGTISSVGANGKLLTLTAPPQWVHFGNFVETTVDERAEVGLLDRTIIITGTGASPTPGNVTIEGPGAVCKLDWVQFSNLGGAGIDDDYPLYFDNAGNSTGSFVNHCCFCNNLN